MSTLKVIQIQHPSAASAALTLDASGNLSTSGTLTFPAGSASSPSIQATGDPNTGLFFPAADTIAFAEGGTEVLRIDSSGRVGIGTSSASGMLHVKGTNPQLIVDTLDASTEPRIRLYKNGSPVGQLGGESGTTRLLAEGAFQIMTNGGTNAVYVDSSQRVGIGTTSLSESLTVNGNIRIAADGVINTSSSSNGLRIQGGATFPGGHIILSGGNGSDNIVFNRSGASSSSIETARIDSSGRLLVGTSTSFNIFALLQVYKASDDLHSVLNSASLSNGTAVLQRVQGGTASGDFGAYKHSGIASPCIFIDLQAQDGASNYYWSDNSDILRTSTSAINIGTTGGTVVGTQTSDERIKNILGPVKYGLDTLKQINPVRFSLKSEPETERLGFIAQQVQPLVPQSVFDTKEHIEGEPEDAPTKLGMEYVALIPVLVNAIKELSAEVDTLKAQLS